MKTCLYYYPVLLACIFMGSCSPVYYGPNTQNVPVFKGKEEIRMMGAADESQINLQGAYAFSEKFAFQVNGAFVKRDEGGNGGGGTLLEGGIGYYNPLSRHFVVECYGLAAFGNMENHFYSREEYYDAYRGQIKASITRIGIQPSIAYTTRYFEAALSTRFSQLHYGNIEGNLTDGTTSESAYLKENNNSILFEPALTLRAGLENVKFQIQTGLSSNWTNPDFRQSNEYTTFGIIAQF